MKKIIIILGVIIYGLSGMVFAETVIYNPKSGIYHNQYCHSAKICKVCIKINKKEAQRRGGRACKKCGG